MLRIVSIMLIGLFFFTTSVFAEPVINKNVHIIKNATPAQCLSSMRGKAGEAMDTTYTGVGEQDIESAPGVRTCTGCAIDSASGDCVCETCYDYFDSL